MKGIRLLVAAVVVLAAGAALAATSTHMVKGEESHHLLMLDVREAATHAKTLNHYAGTHAKDLDKAVLMKHIDELTRNLEGIRTELGDVEQKMGSTDKAKVEKDLATIRTEEEKAWRDLETLKTEAAKPTPDPNVIEFQSKAILSAMRTADQRHNQVMVKRGVHEPKETPQS